MGKSNDKKVLKGLKNAYLTADKKRKKAKKEYLKAYKKALKAIERDLEPLYITYKEARKEQKEACGDYTELFEKMKADSAGAKAEKPAKKKKKKKEKSKKEKKISSSKKEEKAKADKKETKPSKSKKSSTKAKASTQKPKTTTATTTPTKSSDERKPTTPKTTRTPRKRMVSTPVAVTKPSKPKMPPQDQERFSFKGRRVRIDDLKVVEGIGPKIESLLKAAGIPNWEALAKAPQDKLQGVLDEAGPRFRMHKPDSWSHQAQLAHDRKFDELKALQDRLDGGVER